MWLIMTYFFLQLLGQKICLYCGAASEMGNNRHLLTEAHPVHSLHCRVPHGPVFGPLMLLMFIYGISVNVDVHLTFLC